MPHSGLSGPGWVIGRVSGERSFVHAGPTNLIAAGAYGSSSEPDVARSDQAVPRSQSVCALADPSERRRPIASAVVPG